MRRASSSGPASASTRWTPEKATKATVATRWAPSSGWTPRCGRSARGTSAERSPTRGSAASGGSVDRRPQRAAQQPSAAAPGDEPGRVEPGRGLLVDGDVARARRRRPRRPSRRPPGRRPGAGGGGRRPGAAAPARRRSPRSSAGRSGRRWSAAGRWRRGRAASRAPPPRRGPRGPSPANDDQQGVAAERDHVSAPAPGPADQLGEHPGQGVGDLLGPDPAALGQPLRQPGEAGHVGHQQRGVDLTWVASGVSRSHAAAVRAT